MNKKTIQSVFLGMVLLLMYLPILLLAVYSFMDSAIIGRSGSFTVKNYVYLFHSEDLRSMIFGTLILAVIVAVISTILGMLLMPQKEHRLMLKQLYGHYQPSSF